MTKNGFNPPANRPYVIAEAGVNHGCDLEVAKRLVDLAAEGGADAIKFQTYKAGTLASKQSPSYWDLSKEPTRSQFELFSRYDKFGKSEYEALRQRCQERKIAFLSTPFDFESADYLAPWMDLVKISSSDITNRPFIEHLAKFGKPIVLSTGASRESEIQDALEWISAHGNQVILLHCVLLYPTPDEKANLARIETLRERFPGQIVGYSDHTQPGDMHILDAAWRLGARVLEKHFTFDKSLPGNDHYHAMDVDDLKVFAKRLEADFPLDKIRQLPCYGSGGIDSPAEEDNSRLHARRSIVLTKSVKKGQTLSREDLTFKRPGNGIAPSRLDEIVGRSAAMDLDEDTVLLETHIR